MNRAVKNVATLHPHDSAIIRKFAIAQDWWTLEESSRIPHRRPLCQRYPNTKDSSDDRWVMVIKHELKPERGRKNLRLTFSKRMQGPYNTKLGPPIVGPGTAIVNRMSEGPSLFIRGNTWFLYWDTPGRELSYCLTTSPDLKTWINRSAEMSLPAKQMRHGTVLVVPANVVSPAIQKSQ